MRDILLTALVSTILFAMFIWPAAAQERRVADLTANDLAEVLGVHWWIVKIPPLAAHDMVGVEVVDANGNVLVRPGGFYGPNLGNEITICAREDVAHHSAMLTIKTKGASITAFFDDYFKDESVCGVANGTVLQVNDILIKFDKSPSSFSGDNNLLPGQIGFKVVVSHRP